MPTFVYMTSCDGCGHRVDICPSDIMHRYHLPPLQHRAQHVLGMLLMCESAPAECD
jgi:adenylylsulfate reductase subunit B